MARFLFAVPLRSLTSCVCLDFVLHCLEACSSLGTSPLFMLVHRVTHCDFVPVTEPHALVDLVFGFWIGCASAFSGLIKFICLFYYLFIYLFILLLILYFIYLFIFRGWD